MWSNRRTRLALWKVHPMRKLLLTLPEDVTETSCGSCDYASLMPCTEPTIYICTRPEFATRDASGKYETAERPGRTRLPACIAAEERAALLAENARLRAESKRIGWGVVANAGRLSSKYAPRWAYVCEAVGIGSTSAKDLCREHGFDPDESVGPPLGAHASQPQCPSCHGTRTVMDADHDSRVLTADDCPACSQPKGDGGYDA